MPTKQDIYNRLDELASDAHKFACSLDIGEERTEAFALYTVLHRLLRRGAAVHIHDAINPLLVDRSATSKALNDVTAERQRQVSTEGWKTAHDDEHKEGELAAAACCYARNAQEHRLWVSDGQLDWYIAEPAPSEWPWDDSWWKPKSPRQDLVRAAALLVAEIERLDRAAEVFSLQQFEPAGQFSVTNQQYRVEVTSYDTQTRQVEHNSIDLTAEQYKSLARHKAPTEPVVLKFKTPPAESEELNRFYNLVFSPEAFFASWVGRVGHYAYGKEYCVADDQDGFIYLFLEHNGQWGMTASSTFVNWNARFVEINI